MFHLDQTNREEIIPVGGWYYRKFSDGAFFIYQMQEKSEECVGKIWTSIATADYICEKLNERPF